jgi:hypothetical protein
VTDNGDNTLTLDCPDGSTLLPSLEGTLTGEYVVSSELDVILLSAVTRLEGQLTLELEDASLPRLEYVENLVISTPGVTLPALTEAGSVRGTLPFSAPVLRQITGRLGLSSSYNDEPSELPSLEEVEVLSVQGTALTTLEFPSLEIAPQVVIADNFALSECEVDALLAQLTTEPLGPVLIGNVHPCISNTCMAPTAQCIKDCSADEKFVCEALQCGFAAAFGGSDGDYVEVPPSYVLEPEQFSWTVEFWAKVTTDGAIQRLVSKYDSFFSDGFGVLINAANQLEGYLDDGSTTTTLTSSGEFPSDGSFHHVAFVRDNLTYDHMLYLDGALVASSNTSSGTVRPSNVLVLGASLAGDEALNGSLDDVRIWRGARYVEAFTPTRCENVSWAPGLMGEWLFEEGSGASAADTSGNGNDGALMGTVTSEATP